MSCFHICTVALNMFPTGKNGNIQHRRIEHLLILNLSAHQYKVLVLYDSLVPLPCSSPLHNPYILFVVWCGLWLICSSVETFLPHFYISPFLGVFIAHKLSIQFPLLYVSLISVFIITASATLLIILKNICLVSYRMQKVH